MEGLLLVNKPSGPTSYDLIRWIKRKIKNVKIGHCGTLDPLASGLMLILLGRATKKQDGLMGQDKTYLCGLTLGLKTDSGDITGKTIETGPSTITNPDLLDTLPSKLIGPQLQTPPMFSALKIGGTPLYKLARKGQSVERKPRAITIHEFNFLSHSESKIEFRTRCSSGTYVRVLAEDIGRELETVATMSSLLREKIGAYSVADALPGDQLQQMDAEQIESCLQPVA